MTNITKSAKGFKMDSRFKVQYLEHGTWNLEPGTWNMEHGTHLRSCFGGQSLEHEFLIQLSYSTMITARSITLVIVGPVITSPSVALKKL